MGENGKALQERIESLSGPGTKETEEAHAGITTLWTTCSPTDLARNDEWAHTALGEIVLSWPHSNNDSVAKWKKEAPLHATAFSKAAKWERRVFN